MSLCLHIESKPATDICLDFGRHSFCQFVKQTLRRKGLSNLNSLGNCSVLFHQMSKPDFFILNQSQDFTAIRRESPVPGDDDVHLVGLAGECTHKSHNRLLLI